MKDMPLYRVEPTEKYRARTRRGTDYEGAGMMGGQQEINVEQGVIDVMKACGIDTALTLPCDRMKKLLPLIPQNFREVRLMREEGGVGIAAGLYMAGRKPAMVIQSTGLGNSMTRPLLAAQDLRAAAAHPGELAGRVQGEHLRTGTFRQEPARHTRQHGHPVHRGGRARRSGGGQERHHSRPTRKTHRTSCCFLRRSGKRSSAKEIPPVIKPAERRLRYPVP